MIYEFTGITNNLKDFTLEINVTTPDPSEYDFQETYPEVLFIDGKEVIDEQEIINYLSYDKYVHLLEVAIEKYWSDGGAANEYAGGF